MHLIRGQQPSGTINFLEKCLLMNVVLNRIIVSYVGFDLFEIEDNENYCHCLTW